MATSDGNNVTVNVHTLSNALAVAIQQASSGSNSSTATVSRSTNQGGAGQSISTIQGGAGQSISTIQGGAGQSTSSRGRPRTNVVIDDIIALRALNYKWTKIALMLNISRATLYRKLEEAGISPCDNPQLSDSDLDDIVVAIKRDHPNDGEVMMQGHLTRLGIKVTRKKLRLSIHRVDHENTLARRKGCIKRRVYSVSHPNAIWHIDTHHKLIRWRFIIHAGVDGFSRTIVYIKCDNNNRASTALNFFREGLETFGLPDSVRSDHGGENVDIWRLMIASHNGDVSCILTGSSTHNQRVERLWRYVHRSVGHIFSDVFRSIESEGYLDPLNEVDLFCLRHIYLPRINQCLQEFKESWNNHSLSTEGNKSPLQLFLEGTMCAISDSDCVAGVEPAMDDISLVIMF